MKKTIITSVLAAAAATFSFAGDVTVSKNAAPVGQPCVFRNQEIQFDLFGLGDFYKGANNSDFLGLGSTRSLSGRPAWGGGLGVNYIFARYFGVGIEQSLFGRNRGNTSIDGDGADYAYTRWQTTANFILRYPICSWNLAPYMLVGGGAQYGNVPDWTDTEGPRSFHYSMAGQGFGHVGGGLEWRPTHNIGVFSDLRYLYSGVNGLANNQMQWRYGLRFAF
jgi:opacity protein-like surface antigen